MSRSSTQNCTEFNYIEMPIVEKELMCYAKAKSLVGRSLVQTRMEPDHVDIPIGLIKVYHYIRIFEEGYLIQETNTLIKIACSCFQHLID